MANIDDDILTCPTCSRSEDICECGDYTVVISADYGWGSTVVEPDEHVRLMAAMESRLTECEPDGVNISVRSPRRNEAAGTYRGEQILGYSVPVPDGIRDLVEEAWEHAVETWEATL